MNTIAARRMLVPVLLLVYFPAWAQAPKLNPNVAPAKQIPVVKFEFVMPGADPPHYAISIEGGGAAAYRSDENPVAGSEAATAYTSATGAATGANEAPYFIKFAVSHATADRIFKLAAELNFFQGDFEYHGGRVANMGAKTFTFQDGKRDNSFTYNYTQNQKLQELTSLMQGIASSLEFRRHLERLYRFEKLGLDDELARMETAMDRGYLAEAQLDEPILQEIVNDHSVMNISRKKAQRLLGEIAKQGGK